MANEANQRGYDGGWLVFEVNNRTPSVLDTGYCPQAERLHSLKIHIAENAEPRITSCEIHELPHADGCALLIEIPAAPQGIPIAWKRHYYAGAGLDDANGSWCHVGYTPENVRYYVVDSFSSLMENVK